MSGGIKTEQINYKYGHRDHCLLIICNVMAHMLASNLKY